MDVTASGGEWEKFRTPFEVRTIRLIQCHFNETAIKVHAKYEQAMYILGEVVIILAIPIQLLGPISRAALGARDPARLLVLNVGA